MARFMVVIAVSMLFLPARGCDMTQPAGLGSRFDRLVHQLKTDRPLRRILAAADLGHARDPRAVPVLLEALNREKGAVRLYVLRALSEIGHVQCLEAFISAMSESDPRIRYYAVRGMAKIRCPASVETLVSTMSDTDVEVRACAATALHRMSGDRAVPCFVRALRDEREKEFIKIIAARHLAGYGGDEAATALMQAVENGNPRLCAEAVTALGKRRESRAVPMLLDALHNQGPRVRMAVIEALGEIRDERALGPLEQLTQDADPAVQEAAWYAYSFIKSHHDNP